MTIFRLKGASGAVINQSHALGARTLIGRADDCDLRVDQEGVAGRHAEVVEDGHGGLTLNHLADGYETTLNGEVVQSAALASGDEIRIANCRWVLQAPGLRPEISFCSTVHLSSPDWVRRQVCVGLWPKTIPPFCDSLVWEEVDIPAHGGRKRAFKRKSL